MTNDKIKEIIFEIISTIAPEADLQNLDFNIKFRDQFEFSSIDFLNFILKLEKKLDIKIPETDCPKLATLDGGIAYIKSIL